MKRKSIQFSAGEESTGLSGLAEAIEQDEKESVKPEAEEADEEDSGKPKPKNEGEEEPDADEPEEKNEEVEGDEKPEVVKEEEKKDEKKDEPTPDEDDLPAVPVADADDEKASWADVAVNVGMTPPKDPNSFDEFKENYQRDLAKAREEGRNENIDIKKYDPVSRDIIKSLNSGMKIGEILAPAAAFDERLAMAPEDMVRDFLVNGPSNMDEELANEQIEVLKANGQFDVEVKKLRVGLQGLRQKAIEDVVKKGAEAWDAEQARVAKETEEDNKKISAELEKRTHFMERKVTPQHRQHLFGKWSRGEIQKEFENNPEAVVDFMLFKEYGKTIFEDMKKKAQSEAKVGKFKELSNSAPTEQGGSQAGAEDGSDDPFSSIREGMQKGVKR